ncbi:MAG: hypothetical protein FJ147_08385 [Deltaproteobacteria bacterium]|nr:hypothetical protein [Deltaproteobacteria bacterium]
MSRMRKGLAALIAAFFFLGVGGNAQAVVGVPDDVPGSTLLYPFFKVQTQRTATDNQDTLVVVTNTAGATSAAVSAAAPNVAVHVTIWSITSQHIYDFTVILTPHDVFTCSLYDLLIGLTGCSNGSATIQPAPTGVAAQLLAPAGSVTGLIAGYVTADVVYSATSLFPGQLNYPFGYGNVLVGQQYLVNLPAGSSSGVNATSIETANPCYGHRAVPDAAQAAANTFGFYRTRCIEEQGGAAACTPPATVACNAAGSTAYGDLTERIDGPNGDLAQTGSAGGYSAGVAIDSPLSLIVRYFSQKELNGKSEIWLWKDRVTAGAARVVNTAVYDEAENVHSVTFTLADEVNFKAVADIITPGVAGGWFRISFPCLQFTSCAYNYSAPATTTPPIQAVAYSVQFADSAGGGTASAATLRWDAIFPAHRQYTNYTNISE